MGSCACVGEFVVAAVVGVDVEGRQVGLVGGLFYLLDYLIVLGCLGVVGAGCDDELYVGAFLEQGEKLGEDVGIREFSCSVGGDDAEFFSCYGLGEGWGEGVLQDF